MPSLFSSESGLGMHSFIEIPCPGVIPHVTVGAMVLALKETSSSNTAESSLLSFCHHTRAFS